MAKCFMRRMIDRACIDSSSTKGDIRTRYLNWKLYYKERREENKGKGWVATFLLHLKLPLI